MNLVITAVNLQLLTLLATSAAAFNVTVTVEKAGVQRTTAKLDHRGIETFDGFSLGQQTPQFSSFLGFPGIDGTYIGLRILQRDTLGGAHGMGRYPVARNLDSYTLFLNQTGLVEVNYFGFWLSALDEGNHLTIFSSVGLAFELTPGHVMSLVGNNTAYFGNPTFNPRVNTGEVYVFVNIFCNDCIISHILFHQTRHFGFESDNHTIGHFKTQSRTNGSGDISGSVILAIGAAIVGGVAVVAWVAYLVLKSESKPKPIEGEFMDSTEMASADELFK